MFGWFKNSYGQPAPRSGEPTNQKLLPVRHEIEAMATELFVVIGIPFEKTSELQRQLLAVFAFGMVFVVGQIKKLSPPEVHALAIMCLMDVFKYADHQAGAFSEQLISASSDRKVHPTIHDVIHQGIDGHALWQHGNTAKLRSRIQKIFEAVGA